MQWPLPVAFLRIRLDVVGDDLDGKALGRPERHPPDRPGMRVQIEQSGIAFGRAIEFDHTGNAEALLERGEDVRPQAVAEAEANLMRAIPRARRRVDEKAAHLADIDEHRAFLRDDVAPERARREPLADPARAAGGQRHARRQQAAVGVIHRQAIVHAIAGPRAGGAGKPQHYPQHPAVGDARGLRQSSRARGVDEQRRVAGRQRGPFIWTERGVGQRLDLDVDARVTGRRDAMAVDGEARLELRPRGCEGRHQPGLRRPPPWPSPPRCNGRAKDRSGWC